MKDHLSQPLTKRKQMLCIADLPPEQSKVVLRRVFGGQKMEYITTLKIATRLL